MMILVAMLLARAVEETCRIERMGKIGKDSWRSGPWEARAA